MISPEDAIKAVWHPGHGAMGRSSKFNCPHCHALTQQEWGQVATVTVLLGPVSSGVRAVSSPIVTMARCTLCNEETVFVEQALIFPSSMPGPVAAHDMPNDIRADYEEARAIYRVSPRGAAALLRLAIQKLCPLIGATKSDINAAIGELVRAGTIPATVQQALDSVRVIGNEAVHPGVMDLRDDVTTVEALFGLINFIVEKSISEPERVAAIYRSLPPSKLAGIVQRDGRDDN